MTRTPGEGSDDATAQPRYFHGTFATMAVGEVVVPGNELGLTHHGRSREVYATTDTYDPAPLEWLPAWDTLENRTAAAIDEALEWAAHAADTLCQNPAHLTADNPFHHYEHVIDGHALDCLHVYEVEPLGPVHPDPSTDPGPSAVVMARARVIAQLDLTTRPQGHFEFDD